LGPIFRMLSRADTNTGKFFWSRRGWIVVGAY
jgi:hypothetical protein